MNADGDAFRQRIEEIADDDLDPDARFRFNLFASFDEALVRVLSLPAEQRGQALRDMNLPRTAEALRL